MRLSDDSIAAVAVSVRGRLSNVIALHGALTLDDIRGAVVAARRDDPSIPNVSSERSLRLVEAALTEM